jgi:hypothetical protein
MQIKYGVKNTNIDVTNICLTKLLHNNIITIPSNDHKRAYYFTDPICGTLKKIFIFIDDNIKEYDDTQTIKINLNTKIITTHDNNDINQDNLDEKIFAYYFPQYHPIPENDIVFGKDFSDWDLFKTKSKDELKSYKIPIDEPKGLSYYDPTLLKVRQRQKELANKYGIDGFIYYHYWLENKPVMTKVLDTLLVDDEPNIPFCFCFANESWKHCYNKNHNDKTYKKFNRDGSTFRQLYNDPETHAKFLAKFFNHKNYYKIDNKPVLFVYILDKKISLYMMKLSNELLKYGIDGIYYIANTSKYCIKNIHEKKIIFKPNASSHFTAHGENIIPPALYNIPKIHSGLCGWNNKLRHPTSNNIVDHKPLELMNLIYKDLFKMKIDKNTTQLYVIFAWNEWAEGAVLEPNSIYDENLGLAVKKSREIFKKTYEYFIKNTMVFLYGYGEKFINISLLVYMNCVYILESDDFQIIIKIPGVDKLRDKLFTNPIINVHKVIKVITNDKIDIYDDITNINIYLKLK